MVSSYSIKTIQERGLSGNSVMVIQKLSDCDK